MISNILDRLVSADFEASLVASTPRALRTLLKGTSEVRELRSLYDSGGLTGEEIRIFVDGLLREHAHLARFPYQTALAAICVALEDRFSPFAEEYILDLARIKSTRYSMAARLARLCAKDRRSTVNTRRTFTVSEVQSDFEIRADNETRGPSTTRDTYDTMMVA